MTSPTAGAGGRGSRRVSQRATPLRQEAVWFEHLARLDRAKVSWREVVRVAASIVTPLAVAFALESSIGKDKALAVGVFASIGALVGSIAPQRGPLREKLTRTAAGIVLGAVGLAVGHNAAGGGWQPVLLIAALAGIAALVSTVSANVSFGALQFLVYIAVGSGIKSYMPVDERAGLFLTGGLWAMLLTLLVALADRIDPDRAVVSDVFTAVGELLAGSGKGHSPSLRAGVTEALNRAYDQIVASRSHAPGSSRRLAQLAAVLNSTAPLVEGAVTLYRSDQPASREDLSAVAALAHAALTGIGLSGNAPPPLENGTPAARRTREGIRLVWRAFESGEAPRPGGRFVGRDWRARTAELASATVGSHESWKYAVRLALCMGIAEIVRQNLPFERPYWVLLTVAIVLKPDFGSVFARGVQRTVGTVIGVLIGAGVLDVVPHDAWMLIPMAVAAGNIPWAQAANYGLYVVSLTPVIVILLDLTASGGSEVVTARLLDTLVGCGVVLVFGYALWPDTWRSSLVAPFQRVVAALDAFVAAAFGTSAEERRVARRRTFRALTELQTELQRQLAEPPPLSTRAAGWWPVVVQLERTADSVIEGAVAVGLGAPRPGTDEVTDLRRLIRQLDDAPANPYSDGAELFASSLLAPIVREVDTTRRLLREIEIGRNTATS